MSHSMISRLCRPSGPWRRLIPGVVLLSNGTPTRSELNLAALAHAGEGAMLTGIAAARLHGLRRLPADNRVHVLLPHSRRVATRGFAVIERTIYPPDPAVIDGVPVAPLARALIDAAHRMERLDDIRAMIAEAVQRGLCEPADLRKELEQGTTIGSALPRRVISEMERGIRSAAEAWAVPVVRRAKLPAPQWNVEIRDANGKSLGITDAYWEEVALALEVDSLDWHLNPEGYERTMRKHTAMAAAGILVVHILPKQLRNDPLGVIRALRAAYQQAAGRPPPPVHARPWRRAA
ncbi:hypothetical protein [Amycolatopsis suaedae]|nr:hypothetical protein [Amycolatopsis suaedae]